MKFLEVNSPKTVEQLLKKDIKQANAQVANYKDAIKDVQGKIKDLTERRKGLRESVAELDNKILACANEADRLMEGMTEIMGLIDGYKNL